MARFVPSCDSVATVKKSAARSKQRRDHVHLMCFECGRIEEVAGALFEDLKAAISRETEFEIRGVRLEVGGRCRSCRDSSGRTEKLEGGQ